MIPAHDGTLHVAIGKAAECQMMGLTTAESLQTVIATRFYAERLDSGLKSSADSIYPEGGFGGLRRWLGITACPCKGEDGNGDERTPQPAACRYAHDAQCGLKDAKSHARPVMSTAKAEHKAPSGAGSGGWLASLFFR